MTAPQRSLTLAIHPTSRGFGWIVFEGPFTVYDWGLCKAAGDKNLICLGRAEQLLNRFQPATLVLEAFEGRGACRSPRIARLGRALSDLAAIRGADVEIFTRAQVRAGFATVGAYTRQEIAQTISFHIDILSHRLPRSRRAWDSEDPRMSLFSAAALVLTHYHFGANRLFEDLKRELEG